LILTTLSLTGCDDGRSGGKRALREAEKACGLSQGRLSYLGGSDDPLRKNRSFKPPLNVVTGAISPKGERVHSCLDSFVSTEGYRIEQLITDNNDASDESDIR
jgi:hypothetical protein